MSVAANVEKPNGLANRKSRQVATALALSTSLIVGTHQTTAFAFCIDTPPVGDGWGRDGTSFCQIEPGCDYTDASLNAGFGWNPLTEKSCLPVVREYHDDCDYSAAELNRGWGWSNSAAESCPPTETTISRTCDYSDATINEGYGWNDAEQLSCAPLTDTTVIESGDSVFIASTLQDDVQTDGLQSITRVTPTTPVSEDQIEFPDFDLLFDIDVDNNSITLSAIDEIVADAEERFHRYFIGFTSSTITTATVVGSDLLTDNITVAVLEPGFVLESEFFDDGDLTDAVDFFNGAVMIEFAEGIDPVEAGDSATIIFDLGSITDNITNDIDESDSPDNTAPDDATLTPDDTESDTVTDTAPVEDTTPAVPEDNDTDTEQETPTPETPQQETPVRETPEQETPDQEDQSPTDDSTVEDTPSENETTPPEVTDGPTDNVIAPDDSTGPEETPVPVEPTEDPDTTVDDGVVTEDTVVENQAPNNESPSNESSSNESSSNESSSNESPTNDSPNNEVSEDSPTADSNTDSPVVDDTPAGDSASSDAASAEEPSNDATSTPSLDTDSSPQDTGSSSVVEPQPASDTTSAQTTTRYTTLPLAVPANSPGGLAWADSYSYQNQCYIHSSFDHGAGELTIGGVSVKTIQSTQSGPGIELADAIYNDVNCGNGPANTADDEIWCPGRVDLGPEGCIIAGPNILDQL
jgi:hypothetical protein